MRSIESEWEDDNAGSGASNAHGRVINEDEDEEEDEDEDEEDEDDIVDAGFGKKRNEIELNWTEPNRTEPNRAEKEQRLKWFSLNSLNWDRLGRAIFRTFRAWETSWTVFDMHVLK